MNLIEPFRNSRKKHDPEKIPAHHEVGHALIDVSFGLLPEYTSLIGFSGNAGFNSITFYGFWDVGVNWKEDGHKCILMGLFGGVIGSAYYSGFYDWSAARFDLKAAEHVRKEYTLTYRQVMAIWLDTHYVIEENGDLLKQAAEKLYKDRILSWEYWERVLLSV